jgi:hypothetical protein
MQLQPQERATQQTLGEMSGLKPRDLTQELTKNNKNIKQKEPLQKN